MVMLRLNEANYFNYLIQRSGILLNTHVALSEHRITYFLSIPRFSIYIRVFQTFLFTIFINIHFSQSYN